MSCTATENAIPTLPAKGNLSFVLEAVDKTSFQERPVKPPAPLEVQVNVRQTGICGSDVHYWKHGRIGDFILKAPMVLGHESAGIITSVGSQVEHLKVGDRVALEPGVPCLVCDKCLSGTYNHCAKLVFAATPPYDGTLATYYNLHSSFAHKIPDNLTLEEASLMEPLSVAVYSALNRGEVRAMQNVLVFGAGPIGLLVAGVCKAYGAKRVVVVDILDDKLKFAFSFAATSTFKPSAAKEDESQMDASERNAAELIASLPEPDNDVARKGGFDLVMECTGAPPCIQMGIFAARARAKFVQIGMGANEMAIPIHRIGIKELDMTGSFRYGVGAYETAINLVASGKLDVAKIVTHRYTFADCIKAFDATAKGKGEDGKAVIKVQICQGEA
ncbi:putative xylitol dehydrogenase [Tilletiaria anomala UBC 951]|uniref:Putative xylitol dehydrogenase n=1 Tax=Tilletiaria anomala (strain ATCC 24038 / CBS 436.72 / UBC 951) TaxID=1037660 RepID=A0A066VI68_TILAU|nr:putative xylitol dehydrogenase [Tilletiaria anomala UBC 951]KDN38275.1 putative xylitol dehydrogenase [Tilletiaria anomala UBC 951]